MRHADDLGTRKAAEHGLHQRIALHVALDLGLLRIGLRAHRRRALLLGNDHDPTLAGPAGQFALKIVDQRLRRARLKRDFELAILAADQPHIALQRHLGGDVALVGGKRDQLLRMN